MVTGGDERIRKGTLAQVSQRTELFSDRVLKSGSHLKKEKSKVKKDGGQVLGRGVRYTLKTEVVLKAMNKEMIDQKGKGKHGGRNMVNSLHSAAVLDALQVC